MFSYYNDIQFAEKHWFWLLLIIPVMIAWYIWRLKKHEGEFNFSSFTLFTGIKSSARAKFRHVLFALRLFAFAFIIAALARPQTKAIQPSVNPSCPTKMAQ